jgi:superfamily II DNA helicase RecQ
MRYRLFACSIPPDPGVEADLNGFLASHRILNVTHHVVCKPDIACLLFVVAYLEGEAGSGKGRGEADRVDYREKLSEADFEVFRRLRELRKQMADEEKVPVYNVFTNAQLAQIAERRVQTRAALEGVEGVGQARLEKYGERLLALCNELMKPSPPTEGAADETGGGAV